MRCPGGALPGMRRLAIGALLLVPLLAIAGAVAWLQLAAQRQSSAGSATCSPAPCADAGGYTMHVDRAWSSGGLLHLQVSFTVQGRRNMHAVPDDFRLGTGSSSERPWFDAGAGCPQWPSTSIPDGGRLGPRPLCFRDRSNAPPFTLNWNPDLGISEYFSSGYDVRIAPAAVA